MNRQKVSSLHNQGVSLRGANLRRANLRGADLRRADLFEAKLRGADLFEADLRGANLRGANLRRADLRGANLRETNLEGADLFNADLSGADLSGANLRQAYLMDAHIKGANLHGTIYEHLNLNEDPDIIKRVAIQVLNDPEGLEMFYYHNNYEGHTTHSIAGWACVLDKECAELEKIFGTKTAATFKLGDEVASHFSDSNEEAIEFLKTKV